MRINKEIGLSEFAPYAASFRDADHWLPEMTDEVLASVVEVVQAYIEEAQPYEDTQSAILVRLGDGHYGIFQEWSDSSGHG